MYVYLLSFLNTLWAASDKHSFLEGMSRHVLMGFQKKGFLHIRQWLFPGASCIVVKCCTSPQLLSPPFSVVVLLTLKSHQQSIYTEMKCYQQQARSAVWPLSAVQLEESSESWRRLGPCYSPQKSFMMSETEAKLGTTLSVRKTTGTWRPSSVGIVRKNVCRAYVEAIYLLEASSYSLCN